MEVKQLALSEGFVHTSIENSSHLRLVIEGICKAASRIKGQQHDCRF